MGTFTISMTLLFNKLMVSESKIKINRNESELRYILSDFNM